MNNLFKIKMRTVRYLTCWVSFALVLISLGALTLNGLNMGLDFTGGKVTEVQVDKTVTQSQLTVALKPLLGESMSVTHSDEDGRWVIRYAEKGGSQLTLLEKALTPLSKQVTVVSNSIVGSQVGHDLVEEGGLALLVAMLSILGYLCVRFEWRLASGSLLALLHDVILVLGFFAFTQLEFNLTVFAAILAILGYSLNDSIIIADRIRELLVAKPSATTSDINDQAVAVTFSRTLVTSGTTLITVSALWLLGGASLEGFATAMFIGVLSGTWSSISIGTVLPEWLHLESKHYMPPELDTAP